MRGVTVCVLVAFATLVFAAGTARADSITLTLGTPLEGKPASSGPPTITFEDTGAGEVTMTFDLGGLSGTEFVSKFFMNCAIDPTSFTFTYVSGVEAESIDTVFDSTSDWKADGTGGYHDIKFTFDTSESARFGDGETSVYTITGTGLTALSFDVYGLADGSNPLYKAVAHVQGLSGDPDSTWMADAGITPVPEPATFLLVATGVAGYAIVRRRSRA